MSKYPKLDTKLILKSENANFVRIFFTKKEKECLFRHITQHPDVKTGVKNEDKRYAQDECETGDS